MSATILVVEDEALVARDLQRGLIGLGYRVPCTAATTADALAAAERHRPDLVLMDIHIRGGDDGITTAAALRERYSVPVVYLTAYGDQATVERAKHTVPHGYLIKPVNPGELRIAVELALYKHAVEREVEASERRCRAALHLVDEGVIAVDPDGLVVSCNRAAEVLTGWPVEDAVDQPLADVLRIRPGVHDHLDQQTPPRPCEVTLTTRSGQLRQIACVSAPLVDQNGARSGAVFLFQDVAPVRRLEEELEISRRMASLGTLVAGVAHEINNPLVYIRSNVEVVRDVLRREMRDQPAWATDADEALADIDAGAERIRDIVAELRDYSRPEQPGRTTSDVEEAIRWAARVTGAELAARARLVLELGALPPVRGDTTRIGRVFVNLLANAAQAIEPGAPERNQVTVRAAVAADGAKVVVVVEDTGCGIAADQLPRLFTPFYTARRRGRGTGLGLALCHGVVTAVGGSIAVESQPGHGTCFRVSLPVADRAREQAPPPPPTAPAAPTAAPVPPEVLAIDRDPRILSAIARTLGPDYRCTVAGSGPEAVALFAGGRRFALVLCDVGVLDRGGPGLIESLTTQFPEQARRLVFVTGSTETPAEVEALRHATHAALHKPLERDSLLRRVGELLRELGPLPDRPR